MVTLQVSIPLWALVHLPIIVTVSTAMFTRKASGAPPHACSGVLL